MKYQHPTAVNNNLPGGHNRISHRRPNANNSPSERAYKKVI